VETSVESLLPHLDRITDDFSDLREGIRKAVRIAPHDPEMALTRSRKSLELVIRDVYQRRCKESPGTRPLENLVQRLLKDGHLPGRLEAYATSVRILGNVGAHRFGEHVTAKDVYLSLTQLLPVVEWYLEAERPPVRPAEDRGPPSGAHAPAPEPPEVLWVDDVPENNAFEIARLRDDGR